MKSKGIMSGALILSAGSVLAKVFSAIYRIGLTRILGGVGIGMYQLIFPFYSLCVILASAGIPMAISKVVAKHKNKDGAILKKCLTYISIICLVLMFILLISSGGLATLQGNKDLTICYIILVPSILLVGFASVLRGYFQGKHNFTPSAVSNIVEQFIKFVVGLTVSLILVKVSLLASVIGAMVSIVVSEIVELFVLLFYLNKSYKRSKETVTLSYKELTKEILPITITNIILPISTFIDSVLVVNLLKVNFSNSMSVFLYGIESGAVSSLISLPTIFSFAIASVILPNLVDAINKNNKSNKLSLAVKVVLIISVPCVIGFLILPNRLIELLYGTRLNSFGVNGVKISSQLLTISSLGVVFLTLNQLFSSSLQAIDKSGITIRNLSIAVFVKFAIELIFMPSKFLNIYALAVANSVCYIVVMCLNYFELRENFTLKLNLTFASKLVLCNSAMIVSLICVLILGNGIFNTILAVLVAVVVYFISLFYFNIFNRRDRAMLKYKN